MRCDQQGGLNPTEVIVTDGSLNDCYTHPMPWMLALGLWRLEHKFF